MLQVPEGMPDRGRKTAVKLAARLYIYLLALASSPASLSVYMYIRLLLVQHGIRAVVLVARSSVYLEVGEERGSATETHI